MPPLENARSDAIGDICYCGFTRHWKSLLSINAARLARFVVAVEEVKHELDDTGDMSRTADKDVFMENGDVVLNEGVMTQSSVSIQNNIEKDEGK
jgi:hypothetical protein